MPLSFQKFQSGFTRVDNNVLFIYKTVGVIGADLSSLLSENKPLTSRMALICGTSSCHMAVSVEIYCSMCLN